MRQEHASRSLLVMASCLMAACSHDTPTGENRTTDARLTATASESRSNAFTEWSEPINLGPPISVPFVTDANATLSPDGLSLYYDSNRTDLPGAQGARDMWVSRRACADALDPGCAWQTPVNLGPRFNTPYVDGGPTISDDGHLLFFLSHTTRPDCQAEPNEPDPTRPCDADSFVSWRSDPNDDLGWGPPVALPPGVNTVDEDNVSAFAAVGEPGRGNLYFARTAAGTGSSDILVVPIRVVSRGHASGPVVEMLGPPVAVDELNHPVALDAVGDVRADGRELFFFSSLERPGGMGALDIWTSTRRGPRDAWSAPTNVTELNSTRADIAHKLSRDGQTLLLTSNREMPGPPCRAAGLPSDCGWDIYVSTRERKP